MRRYFHSVLLLTLVACPAFAEVSIKIGDRHFDAVEVVKPTKATDIDFHGKDGYQVRAAEELLRYLERLTGVEPAIVSGQGKPSQGTLRIWLGTAAVELPEQRPSRLDPKHDTYIIDLQDRGLVLAGVYHPRGTFYAAYDFLERLGVRWYFPGELGEYLPQQDTFLIDSLPGKQTPDFAVRQVQFSHAHPEIERWCLRNRMRRWESGYYGHDKFLSDANMRPEWWALYQGKRRGPLYCTANPDFAKQVIKEMVAKAPEVGEAFLSLGIGDYFSFCQCNLCTALDAGDPDITMDGDNSTDRMIHFYNQVADAISQKNPQAHIGISAYFQMLGAPQREPVHPNIVVTYAPLSFDPWHSYDHNSNRYAARSHDDLKRWCQLSDKVISYEYEPVIDWNGLPCQRTRRISRNIRFYKKIGLKGSNIQSWPEINGWDGSASTIWARARMLWDSELDPSGLIRQWCRGNYGPAADAMIQYFNALEDATDSTTIYCSEDYNASEYFTPDLLSRLRQHMDEAIAAGATGDDRKRLDLAQLRLEYTEHYMKMRHAIMQVDFQTAMSACDSALAAHAQIQSVKELFAMPNNAHGPRHDSRITLRGGWRKEIVKQLEKTNGVKGNLVTLLPEFWKFKTDPQRVYEVAGWIRPKFDDSAWKELSTNRYWTYQWPGDYHGIGVYRTKFSIAPSKYEPGRRILLNMANFYGRAHVYVNGRKMATHPWHHDWWREVNLVRHEVWDGDITDAVKLGQENQITIVAETYQWWSGSLQRMFLWSPVD